MGSKGPKLELLIMGVQGSGKTVLVRRIKQLSNLRTSEEILDTMPTLGVELDEIPVSSPKCTLVLREVGGSFVPVWKNFYSDCGAWVFVLDASNYLALAEAAVEFMNVAKHPEMGGKPAILVLNKVDSAATIKQHEFDTLMRLSDLKRSMGSKLHVVETSAVKGTGIEELMGKMATLCTTLKKG